MLPDHYATLGIAPKSPPAAIRAAYVELMRRYHPDRNPSTAGQGRVRAITLAYAILGAPERRAAYDEERSRLLAVQRLMFTPPPQQWRLMPLLTMFSAMTALVLLLPLLMAPPVIAPQESQPLPTARSPKQELALDQGQTTSRWNPVAQPAPHPVPPPTGVSDEAPIASLAGVAEMPDTAADGSESPPLQRAQNKRPGVIEPMSPPARLRKAAVARLNDGASRAGGQEAPVGAQLVGTAAIAEAPKQQAPIQPAWLRPLPPPKPAWLRPLPPINGSDVAAPKRP